MITDCEEKFEATMRTFLLFLFIRISTSTETTPCSLIPCEPGKCIDGDLGVRCKGFVGCYRTCPPESHQLDSRKLSNIYFLKCYTHILDDYLALMSN